jgi:succinate dehydrogenase / fumarate reductase flavoprotein subunit
MANPCYTQIHPTCIPVTGDHQSKLTLMSESLRNDGRIWVPKNAEDCDQGPARDPEEDRDYYLERIYPAFGNLVPRDIASRQAKNMCDEGRGVGPEVDGVRRGVYLDFADAIERSAEDAIEEKYGNLFDMYARITGEDPYEVPMRIYPAVHYVMGGLWVDYDLQSTIPGLFVTGEANFSDHGANRLGASALMQGLADGYFVLPRTRSATTSPTARSTRSEDHPAVVEAAGVGRSSGSTLPDHQRHPQRRLLPPRARQHHVGVLRHGAHRGGPAQGDRPDPQPASDEFWRNVKVLGTADTLNQSLEKAGRVADFFELGELMCIDALNRRESCGGHFRASRRPRTARRCATTTSSPTSPPGSGPAGRQADPAQGRPGLHGHRDEAAELQSDEPDPQDLAPARPRRRGAMHTYELDDISEDMSSSRCSTSSTSS